MNGPPAEVDVIVVGAGPAGCVAGAMLARAGARVVVFDAGPARPPERIGESLPGAALRLLGDIGVRTRFASDLADERHLPCHVRFSRWGGPDVAAVDSVTDMDGPGYTLDRRRFEVMLRRHAAESGVQLRFGTTVTATANDGRHWIVRARAHDPLTARVLVDASGRTPRGRLRIGAPGDDAAGTDRLVCFWTTLREPAGRTAGHGTYVESTPTGWWYTTRLPGGRRMIAFHTDADLGRRHDLAHTLVKRVAACSGALASMLGNVDPATAGPTRVVRAGLGHPVADEPAGRPRPIRVGDASFAVDPIAGQGLFHSLYTGLSAATATSALLDADPEPLRRYESSMTQIAAIVAARHVDVYAAEQRWADEPFWRRRTRLSATRRTPAPR